MGLFDSDEKKEQQSRTIRPVVLKTQNVAKEIMELAKKNGVNPNSLDFDILEVTSYTRVKKEKEDVEWTLITPVQLLELDTAADILNKNFEIKQIYEIEIYTKDTNNLFRNFYAAIGANATKCKIYLSIKAGSELSNIPSFDSEFLNYINKSKIRAGILIGIFDEMLKDVISKISATIRVEGSIKYDKNHTILVADAYEPTATIDDALILHYDKNNNMADERTRVDYAKRGFIKSVVEDDILIEYIKPKNGKPGRNCRGEFLEPMEPKVKNVPDFSVDDTIEIIDEKDNIIYKAKTNGYISLEAKVYRIKSDVDVQEISFRTTGSVSTGFDSKVSLSVKENDYQKDAIGSGMEVEVNEIDIKGNVGPSAKVYAKRATVDGQTHKTSHMEASDLTINIHKGTAFGDSIKITRLEHGAVQGKNITVGQALGGSISGRDVEIDLCASYVKVTASRLIEIKKLQGSENIFTIDPLLQKETKDDSDDVKNEIEELKKSVNEIKKEVDKYIKIVQDNQAAFNEVKQRLIHYKKNGIQMPASFVTKYKQFQKIQEHLENIKNEYSVKNDKLLLLTTRKASFQDNIADARVINRDRWIGHNEIIFKLTSPPIQISYKPKEGSHEHIFALVEKGDGEFEIRAVSE